MYLTECYMLEEDSLLCLHSGIYILSWTDIQAKGPKGQRAKGPKCRTRSVDSRDGPFKVRATTDLVIAYYEVQT